MPESVCVDINNVLLNIEKIKKLEIIKNDIFERFGAKVDIRDIYKYNLAENNYRSAIEKQIDNLEILLNNYDMNLSDIDHIFFKEMTDLGIEDLYIGQFDKVEYSEEELKI